MNSDFQKVNGNTKDILRELASNTEGNLTVEFLSGDGSIRAGVVKFYNGGDVSVSDEKIIDTIRHLFWFDEDSAKAWQAFTVETSHGARTYADTPLQLVTSWRPAPSTSPVEALQSPNQSNPISDNLPTHLEWHKPDEKPSDVYGKDFYGYSYLVCHGSGEFFSVCQCKDYSKLLLKSLSGWYCFDSQKYVNTKIIAWARLYPKE